MAEYRPASNDDEAFRQALFYAFSPASGPPDDEWEEVPEPAQPGEPRGLYDDEALLVACKHHWFDTRVRGHWVEMAGLSAVATPPQFRRRGHVREIVEASLHEYRERGTPVATLWPFEHQFYARMGWAIANRYVNLEGPPDALAFARRRINGGDFSPLEPSDFRRMNDVLQTHAAPYALAVDRSEEWWTKRVFQDWSGDPYVYGWERDGELRAYVVYRIDQDGDRFRVLDWAHVDHEARLALLAFLSNHDSQVETVRLYEPDASLLDLLPDPGEFETKLHAGPMVRIVDVEDALAVCPAPSGVEGRLRLEVDDPLVDWNDGTFELAFDGGEVHVERVKDADDADVDLEIGALSQLLVGYRGIDDLQKTDDAAVENEEAADLLRLVYPPTEVFLREGF